MLSLHSTLLDFTFTADDAVPLMSLTFSADGSQLLSLDKDGHVALWDLSHQSNPTVRPAFVAQACLMSVA